MEQINLVTKQLRNMPAGNLVHNRNYIADELAQANDEVDGYCIVLNDKIEDLTVENDILRDEREDITTALGFAEMRIERLEGELLESKMEADTIFRAVAKTFTDMLNESNPALMPSPDIAAVAGLTIRNRVIQSVFERLQVNARSIAEDVATEYFNKED